MLNLFKMLKKGGRISNLSRIISLNWQSADHHMVMLLVLELQML